MVELVLTDKYAEVLLLINAIAVLLYLASKRKNKRRAVKFGNFETLKKVSGGSFIKSSNLVLLVRLSALTALIIGISSPVLVEQVPAANSDYVLAIDSSGSMLSGDFKPNRFSAAKDISSDFVRKLSDTTGVGVVSFSGTVKTESEIISDRQSTIDTIQNVETGGEAGTAIGDAVSASTSLLLDSNMSKKIILITDGRNNVGSSINESASFAERNNVTVNTVGIGSKRNETQDYGIVAGQNASKAQFPNLNSESLSKLADRTGGEFKTVTDTSSLRSALVEIDTSERREDFSTIFIFLGVGLLLVEWMMGATKYSVMP